MSVLSTGSSALLAFQRALGTVGHNVANVNTQGYSRQRVELENRVGQNTGVGYVGNGVSVARLQRLADGLVFARQVDSSGEMGRLQQLNDAAGRLDSVLGNPATSLSKPWAAFFGAAKSVVAEPGSSIARQSMIDAGDALASRFRTLDAQMATLGRDTEDRLAGQVDMANQLAGEIARLNRDIVVAGPNASNDLIDQRDLRITRLAGLTGAEIVEQDDGAMNVFAGGQPLVLGDRAGKLALTADPFRADRKVLALDSVGGPVQLPPGAVSGEIGGILEFRGRVLDPARAELGRLATAFAASFNATHRGGVDYNGAPGTDFFSIPAPPVQGHGGNTGTATFTTGIADVGALKGLDVELRFAGGSWSAVRPGTGEPVAMAGAGTSGSPFVIEGVSLVVGGAPANGDRFSLRPTLDAAAGLKVAQRDPNAIAAAAPFRVAVDATNLGNARPGSMQVTNAAAFSGFTTARIDFIDATNYTVDGAGPFAYTAGQPITGAGWSVTFDGAPEAGDTFDLSRTPARSTDNGNARLLGGLDQRGLLDGGATGLTTGLSRLTARVGSEAQHAALNLEAQTALHDQVIAERDSTSGVNLDEEAADLLRFQQAYQAAAQVISTADNMFQTLLGAVSR
ncbi:flagellar hook-associated protein FlgK [Lysobacter humi (ex Lee et al. 2017)]